MTVSLCDWLLNKGDLSNTMQRATTIGIEDMTETLANRFEQSIHNLT